MSTFGITDVLKERDSLNLLRVCMRSWNADLFVLTSDSISKTDLKCQNFSIRRVAQSLIEKEPLVKEPLFLRNNLRDQILPGLQALALLDEHLGKTKMDVLKPYFEVLSSWRYFVDSDHNQMRSYQAVWFALWTFIFENKLDRLLLDLLERYYLPNTYSLDVSDIETFSEETRNHFKDRDILGDKTFASLRFLTIFKNDPVSTTQILNIVGRQIMKLNLKLRY
jgi:hypothetical protein